MPSGKFVKLEEGEAELSIPHQATEHEAPLMDERRDVRMFALSENHNVIILMLMLCSDTEPKLTAAHQHSSSSSSSSSSSPSSTPGLRASSWLDAVSSWFTSQVSGMHGAAG